MDSVWGIFMQGFVRVCELHAFNHDLMSRWDISRLVNLFLSKEIVLVMYMFIDLSGKTSLC